MSYYADTPEQVASLVDLVKKEGERALVVVAGPPLSGKTYLSLKLTKLLSPRTLLFGDKYSPLPVDLFVGSRARELYKRLGLGLYHPSSYDVSLLRGVVEDLLELGKASLNLRTLEGGKVEEREVPLLLPEGGVLVVEGLFACRFLEDLSSLCVYVDVEKKLELVVRRIVRMAYGLSSEESIRLGGLASVAWELFGEEQRKSADVLYLNKYRVLEDVGRPSYQFKVCRSLFEKLLPQVGSELSESPRASVEDYIVTEWPERLRLRVFDEEELMEVSYRYYVPEGVPYLRVAKFHMPSNFLPAFLLSLRSVGFRIKVVRREITFLEKNGVLFKYYPERNVVEMESADLENLKPYLSLFKGRIMLKSYYTGGVRC